MAESGMFAHFGWKTTEQMSQVSITGAADPPHAQIDPTTLGGLTGIVVGLFGVAFFDTREPLAFPLPSSRMRAISQARHRLSSPRRTTSVLSLAQLSHFAFFAAIYVVDGRGQQ